MKQNSAFAKVILCFLLSALVLTSCGEGESSGISSSGVESSENVSTEKSEDVSESFGSGDSLENESKEEASENEESSGDISDDAPYKDSEIYPPENAKIIFGDDFPMTSEPYESGYARNLEALFEDNENEGAYYYVCLDFRSSKKHLLDEDKDALFKEIGIKAIKIGENVFVSYATEKMLLALELPEGFGTVGKADCAVYLADKSLDEDLYKKILDGFIPLKSKENLSFFPPENSKVLYGDGRVSVFVTDNEVEFEGLEKIPDSLIESFEKSENEGAYYYVCLDTRVTYFPSFSSNEEAAYYATFGIACDSVYGVHFAYVTKEQVLALADDKGLAPYCQIIWVHENAKEEFISELERD